MNNSVRFSCVALKGTGKKGILPKDADGYYTMPIGGLNTFNSMGDYYPYEGAKELFTGSSALMRRIKTGTLKGEYGHPRPPAGFNPKSEQDNAAFARRVMTIEEKNTCVHFSEVWLDFDNMKDASGKPIIGIMAKLKPAGPYGPALEESLQNPKEEVCFSIRAFTEDVPMRGMKLRTLKEIVVWDFVTEPGINNARKYHAPSLESFEEQVFTKEVIVQSMSSEVEGIAMESTRDMGRSLIHSLGWDFKDNMPSFLKW